MTKVTIVSGFLGAGKTTLIRKMLDEVFQGEKIVLIENEYGEIGIDSGFLKDAGVQITEMNSGCICCTLVGDFTEALKKVIEEYAPERIIIEPSGVGKLSDIISAVEAVQAQEPLVISERIAVVDAKKAGIYLKNFGEFFINQVQYASTLVLSRTQMVEEERLQGVIQLLREHNGEATLVTTPWDQLSGDALRHALEHSDVENLLQPLPKEHHHHDGEEAHECCCHHHEHEECDDPDCECHHHEHDHECEHHHHDHDHHHDHECEHHHDHECEHHHHHHHDECDDPDCECHHHHHHHHGEHDADEVFTSWGRESAKSFDEEQLNEILMSLSEDYESYGQILRAKGIVPLKDGSWRQFDLVPEEIELRVSQPDYTGRFCVIGCDLKEDKLAELFGLQR